MMTETELANWREQVRSLQTGSGDPRIVAAMDRILDAAFQAIFEAKPTLEEWFAILDFIATAGPIQMRGIGWLLGLNQIVEELNNPMGPDATDQCVEGPFHRPHNKEVRSGAPLFDIDDDGDYLFFEGRVFDTRGNPLAGVEIDVWGTDGHGRYSHFDPGQPELNCRGRVRSGPDGRYSIFTKFPQPYMIAGDAMGTVLEAMGHQPWRPAHLHFKVEHAGFEPLTTQICFKGQPYIDVDSALAVKSHLAVAAERHASAEELAARGVRQPYYTSNFDFRLQPAART